MPKKNKKKKSSSKKKGNKNKKNKNINIAAELEENKIALQNYINIIQEVCVSATSESWTTWHRITDLTKNIDNVMNLQNKIQKNSGNSSSSSSSTNNNNNREKCIEAYHEWFMNEINNNNNNSNKKKKGDKEEEESDDSKEKTANVYQSIPCKWKIQDRGNNMGFGVVATEKIAKGETIIKVPASMAITSESALNDEDLGPNLKKDEFIVNRPTMALALYLLFEKLKGKKSKYYLFIQSLPSRFNMLPYYWTLNDFHAMRGSPSFSETIKTVCMFGYAYAYLHKKLLMNEYTFENNKDVLTANTFLLSDFRWAISCVVSRQNPLPSPVDPSKTTLALIPIFEMLNHQPKSCSPSYLANEKCAIIETTCDYEKDDEIFMVYGRRPNRELLIYSGFVMKDNQYNNVIIRLKLNDALARIRMLVLKRENILPTSFGNYIFHLEQNGMPSKNLWYFAHVAGMDKNALTIAMRMSDEEDNEVREKCLTGRDRIIDGTRASALHLIIQYENQLIKNMLDLKTSSGKHLTKNGSSTSTSTLGLVENLIASEYTCLLNSVQWCNTVGKVNEIVGYSQMEILNQELIEKMRKAKENE